MTKPLRICLVMQGNLGWIAGIEYIKNIALALGSLPQETRSTFELMLICSKAISEDIQNQIKPYLDELFYEEEHLQPPKLVNRIRWKVIKILTGKFNPRLDKFFREKSIDFVYPYLSKDASNQPYRSAECIFDFQHKYLTQFFSVAEIQGRDQWFALIANTASRVVLNSKTAEADFHQFFPENAHKTRVLSFKTVPLPQWFNGNPQQTQKEYSLPDRFFLISNQFWQHKNHLIVFEALKLLQEKSIYPVIVCTGHIYDHRHPDYSNTILQTIHKLGLAEQVYLLGLIPKFDQVQLMRRAIAIVQPSLFEGWSTLVEDARCLGKPIILTDLPVHLEQDPPNSMFFAQNSAEDLAELLANWWSNLAPGPDLGKEALAIENAHKGVQSFGYRFLEFTKSFL